MESEFFYINEDVDKALEVTELSLDELEVLVGRFTKNSHRAGMLKGKIVFKDYGVIEVRSCFGNKLIARIEREL